MRKFIIKEIHIRFIGPFILSAFLGLVIGSDKDFLTIFGLSCVFSFTLWQGNAAICMWLRKRYPGFLLTRRRILLMFILGSTYTFVAASIISYTSCQLINGEGFDYAQYLDDIQKSFYICLLIMAIYEGVYLFECWQESILEAEQLKTQHLRTQFEVLKNQVSPHFLFNSLNTLMSIIPENAALAVKFTEQLSNVYRYILQNKDKELINLSTELDFVESYVFLQKIRFGDNLSVVYQIAENYLHQYYIAPLTLQILVENAIKHNIISKAKPLRIDIYIENGKSILVKNNLQQKQSVEPSTKIGLENIRKRYQLLSKQPIDVMTTTQNFIVALPLVQLVVPLPQEEGVLE